VLPEARALIPAVGRLPGIDGRGKMSKSQGNAVPLSATSDEIREAVRRMYTDPNHLRASDPGNVEGNVVFTYLDAFDEDRAMVEELKARYRRGGLGDALVKRRLEDVLQALLAPIRERRAILARDPGYVFGLLRAGTDKARDRTQATLDEVRVALGLFAFET
jgi:tryptophanyl-tRNA synthetase